MIHRERIQTLNDQDVQNRSWVLYWMQSSQRTEYNHALEYAMVRANELGKPVVVFFGLTSFPQAQGRQYLFMLQGLTGVAASLQERGIRFSVQHTKPPDGVIELAQDSCLVVVDRGYVRIEREWRERVAEQIDCPLIQVESNVIVPVEHASPKEEYSAATFRPKIMSQLEYYTAPLAARTPQVRALPDLPSLDITDTKKILSLLSLDLPVRDPHFRGGTVAAREELKEFIHQKLDAYDSLRNDPTVDYLSHMSPYLHFGQISPLYILLEILKTQSPGKDAYIEQLVVRRELSMNFVHYNNQYDTLKGLPQWAQKTLQDHRSDMREYIYTLDQLEHARTHDPYWNAAQTEMVKTGKMHGYMRMYWGKKILEWSETPAQAYTRALILNNTYELDGRDANGYTGVAWCFGKHDRPWKERPIFGKVRYMNDRGLLRKFNAQAYVDQVEQV
jgi:deoxyribodipyrimidine photo-lyase